MAESGKHRKLLFVAMIWLLVLGTGAIVFKYLVSPSWGRKAAYEKAAAEYEDLSRQARERGFSPKPLPEAADPEQVRAMIADLKQSLVGSPQQAAGSLQRVRLALDSFSGYCVFRSDELKNQLAGAGIEMELVDDKADYGRRLQTVDSGDTPLAVFTIDALLKSSADLGRLPATIVLLIDETIGADAMVAYKKAVPNIDALNRPDARIVATRSSPSETLARVVMANFSLPSLPKDGWIDAQGAANVYSKFRAARKNDPRAFVLWEPYVSKALEIPEAHIVIDSSRFRGYIVDVLVVQGDFLLKNEDLAQTFVEAYLRASFELRQRAGGLTKVVAADARQAGEPLSEEQSEKLAQGIWWKNTQENFAHFAVSAEGSAGLERLEGMIRKIADVLVKTGAMPSDPTGGAPNKLFYNRIMRKLYDEKFHPALSGSGEEGSSRPEELPALSDGQWEALLPVGMIDVPPLVFAHGTARLTDQSTRVLEELSGTLRSFPQYYVLVRGRARSEGDAEANRLLAGERAAAAADFLAAQGIAASRVRASSEPPAADGGEAQTVSFVLGQTPY